jgi:hypothetical protein
MRHSIDSRLMKERVLIRENYNNLIMALRKDDAIEAKRALAGLRPADLHMTERDFRTLANAVLQQDLDTARQIFKVEKDFTQTTQTHNPVTGKPWSTP